MNTGKTVFTQLMTMLQEYEFDKCVARCKGNYRVRNFSCRDHLYVMSFAQLTRMESLRDIEHCLTVFSSKLYHSGIKHAVLRNTLVKANRLRYWHIYAVFAQVLIGIARPLYQEDKDFHLEIDNLVYAFDSTTISLCLTLGLWATFREHKGGVKMHFLLDIRGQIPAHVLLKDASIHAINAIHEFYIELATIYVMDKGSVDFFRLFNLIHQKKAFIVSCTKDNMVYEVVSSNEVDKQKGVLSDENVRLTSNKSSRDYLEKFRTVTYEAFSTGVLYRSITNNFEIPSITISELNRERWNVESFFKWIKHHLKIKSFYGTTRNAFYSQIWIVLCTYLLIALAKKRIRIEQSLYNFFQTLGITLFEKMPINEIFNENHIERITDNYPMLFNFSDF